MNLAVLKSTENATESQQEIQARQNLADFEIADACLSGEGGKKEFYEHFHAFVYNACFRYLGHHEEAQEVTNDSFIKAFKQLKKFRKKGVGIRPWLKRIAINTAIDLQRKKLRRPLPDHNESVLMSMGNYEDAIDQLSLQDIHQLLERLPSVLKTVFLLYEIEGYAHKEIATMLKIKEAVSRAYLSRAKKDLRNLFVTHFYEVTGK